MLPGKSKSNGLAPTNQAAASASSLLALFCVLINSIRAGALPVKPPELGPLMNPIFIVDFSSSLFI